MAVPRVPLDGIPELIPAWSVRPAHLEIVMIAGVVPTAQVVPMVEVVLIVVTVLIVLTVLTAGVVLMVGVVLIAVTAPTAEAVLIAVIGRRTAVVPIEASVFRRGVSRSH
jgi:hypothetical protein